MIAARIAVLGLFLPSGCGTVMLSAPGTPDARLAKMDPAQIERRLQRVEVPARNIEVQATLWDEALLAIDGRRSRQPGDVTIRENAGEAAARLDRWRTTYLHDRTSFTVVLELANRPPVADELRADPLADPEAWSFALEREGEAPAAPEAIEVQAIDRYPTRAGGHHWRVVMAVHFRGPPAGSAARGIHRLGLRVRVKAHDASGRQLLGRKVADQGFVLSWRVIPPEASTMAMGDATAIERNGP